MKELVPYTNLETVKDSNGKITEFVVRTVSYLPKDSKITTSGEGPVADNVLYRPLTISYDGTSTDFDYFGADFTIKREDVGLLERGVNVKVKSTTSSLKSATYGDPEDEGGVSIDYIEGDI
ncbi:hypothetical protein [Carboxylicivirga linearis]|uniref:Uncharacterized protein n=1 Tax=Carboxylicivirga linearis TaxID=1628157 RepID=A0ABS5JY97_9BACT|nr:hypothetical protein [Carboxylicivirga linearis]MBS2099846.1 hypothetical protein [Carboxylicivirga linearis]